MYCERKSRHDRLLLNAFLAILYLKNQEGWTWKNTFLAEIAIFKIMTVQHQTRYYPGHKKASIFSTVDSKKLWLRNSCIKRGILPWK